MKQKAFLLLLFLFTVSLWREAGAQNLIIQTKEGIETVRDLGVIQKLTFANGNLLMKNTGGTVETYALTNILKVYFKSGTTDAELISRHQNAQEISLFPNPVGNSFRLLNLPEESQTIMIYRIDGSVILNTQISGENNLIDVSNLNRGLYLLKIQNQVLKFIKL